MKILYSGELKKRGLPNTIAQIWVFVSEFYPYKILVGIFLGGILSLEDYSIGCEFNYFYYNFLGSLAGAFMIWSGSSFIAYQLDKKYDWNKQAMNISIIMILANIIYIGCCMFIIMASISAVSGRDIPIKYYINSFIYASFITTIINLIFISMQIFNNFKKIKYENEILKQENLRSQLEALKNQVNPHFLFNSLNTLISIIDENPEIAKNFTQKLAQVYRYILKAKEKDLVLLSEELQFTEAYEYMLAIRYGENLTFSKNIPEQNLEKEIPPLVLQMLVENAIKHNVISYAKPLQVSIYVDEDENLVVKNNLQPKIINVESAKVGLKNIADRYKLLQHKEIIIEKTNTEFAVKLPLA